MSAKRYLRSDKEREFYNTLYLIHQTQDEDQLLKLVKDLRAFSDFGALKVRRVETDHAHLLHSRRALFKIARKIIKAYNANTRNQKDHLTSGLALVSLYWALWNFLAQSTHKRQWTRFIWVLLILIVLMAFSSKKKKEKQQRSRPPEMWTQNTDGKNNVKPEISLLKSSSSLSTKVENPKSLSEVFPQKNALERREEEVKTQTTDLNQKIALLHQNLSPYFKERLSSDNRLTILTGYCAVELGLLEGPTTYPQATNYSGYLRSRVNNALRTIINQSPKKT